MDGHVAIEANRQALKRIVMLLVSMSCLARHASARSAPVRFLVYFFVGRAEAVVLAFFGIPVEEARPRTPVLPGPSDLLILCARLRVLALLLAQAFGIGLWADAERPVPSAVPALLAVLPLPWPLVPFHDTS